MHLWRQTDCLALTWNYYDTTWNFFQPAVHSQLADDHWTGRTAGEFPIVYYLMAMLWRIIGPSEFAYRLFELLLHFVGSLVLFAIVKRITRSAFWAGCVSLLVFTSPVIVYYGIAFLPDVPAFDLALIGWWYVVRYAEEHRKKHWAWAVFFFSLAALIKVTAGLSLLALLAVLLLETFLAGRTAMGWRLFHHKRFAWFASLLGICAVFAWYAYAASYNAHHGFKYTFNDLWPIWQGPHEEIVHAWQVARDIIVFQVFDTSVWILLGVALVALAVNIRRLSAQLVVLNGVLLLGSVAYVLCWFHALDGHDYYFINPMILLVVVLVSFFWWLDRDHADLLRARWSRWAMVALLLYNTAYAANNMRMRYDESGTMDPHDLLPTYHDAEFNFWIPLGWWGMKDLGTIEPYLRSIDIKKEDRVIFLDDGAINSSLVLMGQRGWTQFGMPSYKDQGTIQGLVERGAKFLLLTDEKWLQEPNVEPYLAHRIGQYGNVHIFDLQGFRTSGPK